MLADFDQQLVMAELEATVCAGFFDCEIRTSTRSFKFLVLIETIEPAIDTVVDTYNKNCMKYSGDVLDLSSHSITAEQVCANENDGCQPGLPEVESNCGPGCIAGAVIGTLIGLIVIIYFVITFTVMNGDFLWCMGGSKDPMERYKIETRMQSLHGTYVPEITQSSSKPVTPQLPKIKENSMSSSPAIAVSHHNPSFQEELQQSLKKKYPDSS